MIKICLLDRVGVKLFLVLVCLANNVALADEKLIDALSPISAASDSESGAAEPQTQTWNWHAQNTVINQGTTPFPAIYSGAHSLINSGEAKETVSADLMAGVRVWDGGAVHVDGLLWQGYGLSRTTGIVAFANGEAFKAGTWSPNITVSRLFLRQTFGFGGEQEDVADGPLTLAGAQDVSRLTVTIGRMSFLDVFDHNRYAGDPRTQFMNWALLANLVWDYGQNSIGYSLGATVELNQPDWSFRYGYFEMPAYINEGNTGSGDSGEDQFLTYPTRGNFAPIFKSYSMATELERRYALDAHPGAVRLLAWLNHANVATYKAATELLLAEGPDADLTQVQAYHYAYGLGLNWEQEITRNLGVFSRLGWSSGQTQDLEFSDANSTGSLGLSLQGEGWGRPDDTVGLAGVISGITKHHQQFLMAGGQGIQLGDGALNYGSERVMESYYKCQIWDGVQVSFDYQYAVNPGTNRDRGPVSIFGIRTHLEL